MLLLPYSASRYQLVFIETRIIGAGIYAMFPPKEKLSCGTDGARRLVYEMTTGLGHLTQLNAAGGKTAYIKELGVGRRQRLQQITEIENLKTAPSRAALVERSSFQRLALDHVSGRQRMQVTLKQLQNWDAFWRILETLGDAAGTFAFWAELRAWRKWELIADVPRSESYHSLPLQTLCDQPIRGAAASDFDSLLFLNEKYLLHGSEYQVDFPLTLDHELFVLIQHNTLRGLLTNMAILVRLSGQDFQGWDDFYTEDLPTPPEESPPSLQFTSLQKKVSHETWIDTIPWANMRDNVIRYQDKFDPDALCSDFLGGLEEGNNDIERRGMILWGDPWTETGWELSEKFIKKWSFLLQGCGEAIKSTNKWRALRGEKRLALHD
ncbi:hypothetical protein UA08_09417 [Talaromyces atroroseus]|uniref:Uncharacterized protein n=1 Tax=Talaromyces atroroseus TaxID=1441469 RepID=A0A1Q5Q694_TALAT|nr:hypothetical protein UA08_09417 [Talaromyces atroroseus]OKL55354.1 hypothetical protein UA08_09417 [Talaromyces atroroseus]